MKKPVIQIREFASHEWEIYKNLRLSALADSPEAFGSTLAKEEMRSDAEWASCLARGADSAWELPLIAYVDDEPAGLAWGRIENPDSGLAHLYQVWVAPGYRRLGIGQMLLDEVIAWAKAKQAGYLELGVTVADSPAMRLYRRAGFEPVGDPRPLRPGSELVEVVMRLQLST